jgi:hypothetical protein
MEIWMVMGSAEIEHGVDSGGAAVKDGGCFENVAGKGR